METEKRFEEKKKEMFIEKRDWISNSNLTEVDLKQIEETSLVVRAKLTDSIEEIR